ncbi:MAG: alpha/beta fold hydrolase, partial [bacterium]|nr:alpha/beta fold hydrolase [bacterium]
MVDKYRKIAFLGCLALFFLPFFTVHAEYDGNPVVLVPGMLASFDKKLMLHDIEDNKWGFIWRGNVYKALIKELENYGYEEGKTLFIAYYDWRKPVDETYKKYLMPKIDEARAKSGKRQVDIVAHSMGGLLARAYIQSNNYQDDVNKIVMMGTPNKGSTEAYVVWEGGIYPNSWNVFYKWGFDVLHWNLKRTRKLPNIQPPLSFREFFPSLRDVLPTTNFVKRDGTLLSLSEMAEKNNFLIDLNSSAHLIKSRVKEARIYAGLSGKTMDEIIIGGICTVDDNTYNRWRDGHPNPDPPTADSDEGDETVLLTSAKLLDIENYTYDGTSHIKIPDDARASVSEFFNPPVLAYLPQPFRRVVQNFVTVPTVRADESDLYVAPDSMLSFTVSPNVDFEVTDPDGKILSRTENQLGEDNANFDDDPSDPDDIILVTIRNPKVGK